MDSGIMIVVVGVVAIIAFLLLREVTTWYFKTSEISDRLKENQIILTKSRTALHDSLEEYAQSRALLVEIRDLLRASVRTEMQIRNLVQGETPTQGGIPTSDPLDVLPATSKINPVLAFGEDTYPASGSPSA